MNILEILKQSMDSLLSNKLRSFLTMIGISIGIAAVMIIVAIGNGGQAIITGEFEKIGASVIQVTPKTKNLTEKEMLTIEDVDLIRDNMPELKNISPMIQKTGKVRIGTGDNDAIIVGGYSQLKTLRGIDMVNGTFFTDYDVKSGNNVAVISDVSAKQMFNTTNVIGKTFTYKSNNGSVKFRIVGLNKDLNPFAEMMGDQYPIVIMAPVSTVASVSNTKYIDAILGTVTDTNIATDVGNKMAKILDFMHKTEDRYYAQNSASMLESINKALSIVTIIIGASAGISLLVGGIGIMNIMLVSVKERTREIGIRKALGARNKDIVLQFLTEAVIMTGFSGVIGIAVGVGIAFAVSKVAQIALPISFGVGLIAFLFSALFGVFFGVYPAKKAADLDPIEALRYE